MAKLSIVGGKVSVTLVDYLKKSFIPLLDFLFLVFLPDFRLDPYIRDFHGEREYTTQT